jgi:class I fructose-bisphosphate aldolase
LGPPADRGSETGADAVATTQTFGIERIEEILGSGAGDLLNHACRTIPAERLEVPGPGFVDRVVAASDRPIPVLRALETLFSTGRLAGTGYMSILPVDQGIEHSAGASFSRNPDYFDPVRIVELAIEGGCNAVATTLGALGLTARRYAHRIPYLLKLNHNEFLSYPNTYDQTMFASVRQAREMGCVAVGATIYFGSPESRRQIHEVSHAFEAAHEQGMATVLWCYLRNAAFNRTKEGGPDYHVAADLTGQANHLGVTLEADIIKQKAPETAAPGFKDLGFGRYDERMYTELISPNPIDMTRWQVANCYMGRIPLINSGGASAGESDLSEAVRTAVVNKRAGGSGLISGRKSFQRPMREGVELLNAIQDVYLCEDVTIA